VPARGIGAGLPVRGLAVGIDEPNPAFLVARPGDRAFGPIRDRIRALRPALWRLRVDWAAAMPTRDAAPALDRPDPGCLRDVQPCAPFRGLRDQLRALRVAQQSAPGHFEPVVVFVGTPDWASRPATGCGTDLPRSQAPRSEQLAGYRRLVRAVVDLGRREGVALRWFSPWNEPNHPYSLSPQRAACDKASPALAPAAYVPIARALRDELEAIPGAQRLVLGELAGLPSPRRRGAGVAEFAAALPKDVACASPVWGQHAYAGAPDPSGPLLAALDAKHCEEPARVWITETGTGDPRLGGKRDTSASALAAQCRTLHEQLAAWSADPRVDAATQYTVREDPLFPVGLVDARLTHVYAPVMAEWAAWGGARDPNAPAPALPASCR
jgi:hypothetical protein